MKQNLFGKILGKIKIFVQDFVAIKTGVRANIKMIKLKNWANITVIKVSTFGLRLAAWRKQEI